MGSIKIDSKAQDTQTRPLDTASKMGAMGVMINCPLFPSQNDSSNGMIDIRAEITNNDGKDRYT